jgi:hypothetical protein
MVIRCPKMVHEIYAGVMPIITSSTIFDFDYFSERKRHFSCIFAEFDEFSTSRA